MYALVMAGGMGRRMREGGIHIEKPLIKICGKPMIERIIDALKGAPSVEKVVVVVSPNAPNTIQWLECKKHIQTFMGKGKGYLQDMIEAVESMHIKDPFLVCMGDLPLLNSELIELIVREYKRCE